MRIEFKNTHTMTKNYLTFDFSLFKESLMIAYNEWDYSEKDAGKYASECAYEDIIEDVDQIDLYNTLRTIVHDILKGSNMTDLKINADDVSDYTIIYSKEIYRALEERSTEDETLHIWDTCKYSENLEELQTYVDENRSSIGYYWRIDKLMVDNFDPEVELSDQDYEVVDIVIETDINQGESIKGSLVVYWEWKRYIGYARKLVDLRIINDDWYEADLITGNEESIFGVNLSVLMSSDELNQTDSDILLLATQRLSEGWKWTNTPTEDYIIERLDLEI